MQNRLRHKILASSVALILMLSTALSGCALGDSDATGSSGRDSQNITSELQEKYSQTQTVEYARGEAQVERDHEFIISYEFDPIDLGMSDYTEIASLYFDAELTQPVASTYDWASDDKKSYSITPWEYPERAVYTAGAEDYPYGVSADSETLFNRGPYADWGSIGTMYLATKVDLTTGKALDKPTVQVVTIKSDLDTPQLSLEIGDDGLVQFTWNEIRGAKAYYIIEFSSDEDRQLQTGRLIGETTDTVWSSETMTDSVTGGVFSMNKDFDISLVTEDDWFLPSFVEEFGKEYDPEDGPVLLEDDSNRFFCVVAVNEKSMSNYSRMLDIQEIASLAPSTIAYNMEKLSDEGFSGYVKGVNMMPSHRWIVMCDGTLTQRLVNYDFAAAKETKETWYFDGGSSASGLSASEVDVIKVPYTVEGTLISGTLIISDYDKDKWERQLESIEKRQEQLRNKTGDVKRDITPRDEEIEPADEGSEEADRVDDSDLGSGDLVLTASSALSEYLALNMLAGVEEVDLTDFPGALDSEYLIDAWMEAFYQNPLILGVSDAAVSRDGTTLYLEYEDDQATREVKQEEIILEVDLVVDEIITDSMTPAEKEFAINEYLCATVVYDDAALENAAKYDYLKVDSEYFDSFTAYGALIDGVGVCASYAAGFKLLADAAGLDCVVVTGYLEGTLGHAWNRVDLGGGSWATVDSTNNDIDFLPNALMNVPDSAIDTFLVEDDLWLIDSILVDFVNESEENEFYHVAGLFFDQDVVVDEIVDQLAANPIAIVRTDYALNDAQFFEIFNEVMMETGNAELEGCYWMGVILMASDYS